MIKSKRRLSIQTETVRMLTQRQLQDVDGGDLEPDPGSRACSGGPKFCGTGSLVSACGCTHD